LRPDSVLESQLRGAEERDSNGLKVISWIGARCFTDDFTITAAPRRDADFHVR
jgi:hypothetical protein